MSNRSFYNEILTEHNLQPEHKHELPCANCSLDGVNPSCGDEIYFDDSVLESGEVVCPGCCTKLSFDLSSLEESETDKNE